MKIEKRVIIGAFVIVFVLALSYSTVSNYLVDYRTVSEVVRENPDEVVWVNGTIIEGSLKTLETGEYFFLVSDGISSMNVSFTGQLPSYMGAKSDILILGILKDTTFHATKIITKCPTKYQS